jgi:hypothetical protein
MRVARQFNAFRQAGCAAEEPPELTAQFTGAHHAWSVIPLMVLVIPFAWLCVLPGWVGVMVASPMLSIIFLALFVSVRSLVAGYDSEVALCVDRSGFIHYALGGIPWSDVEHVTHVPAGANPFYKPASISIVLTPVAYSRVRGSTVSVWMRYADVLFRDADRAVSIPQRNFKVPIHKIIVAMRKCQDCNEQERKRKKRVLNRVMGKKR